MDFQNDRMKELVQILNRASRAYYQESTELMSNFEYDKLYDELLELEEKSGIVLAGSPTKTVGYEVLSDLPKEKHTDRMLSLDKTKDVEVLKSWLGDHKGLLSWKLDGLTIVLTYEGGELVKAVTRGNGDIGEVITSNAKVFDNIPLVIPYKDRLVLRGEAVIKYSDFEKINQEITDIDAKYKNPRNLCSGTVRQLNSKVTADRHVNFFAFSLVEAGGKVQTNKADSQASVVSLQENDQFVMNLVQEEGISNASREEQLNTLRKFGFETVEYLEVAGADELENAVTYFSDRIAQNDFPSDGLVLIYDDIAFGKSLGRTSKFPRDAIAFKWRDEIKATRLLEIEWSASRTGLINPVAIFEPVELEGTTVSRASVHNVSILKELALGIGDEIEVYRANMIIPQIAENNTRSGNLKIPKTCPVCHADTIIKNENGVETLICPNEECIAKQIKSFAHFVSRDAMNIEGLSEATLEKFIAKGIITEYADIFKLEGHRGTIVEMEGFGEKSFENLCVSAKKASLTTPARLLYSLGVAGIGLANAKMIAKEFAYDWHKMENATFDELIAIDGIGDVLAGAYVEYFANAKKQSLVSDILECIEFEEIELGAEVQSLAGLTFVITGSLVGYENRKELQTLIEQKGGKVAGSVSSKTNYLINNDNLSQSNKNKKAKELGIQIITEAEFANML